MLKVYLAGKVWPNAFSGEIEDNYSPGGTLDYRYDIVKESNTAKNHNDGREYEFLELQDELEYCGPSIEIQHGYPSNIGHTPREEREVFERCLYQIFDCDIFFAWIDDKTCYGTLVEIGLVNTKNTKIIIGFNNGKLMSEMWFAKECADFYCVAGRPKEAFDKGLEHLKVLYSSMPYQKYLQTQAWKEKASEARTRAGNRCQLCNAAGGLHVHHRTYERRGRELPEDLIVLCSACHKKFHDIAEAKAA